MDIISKTHVFPIGQVKLSVVVALQINCALRHHGSIIRPCPTGCTHTEGCLLLEHNHSHTKGNNNTAAIAEKTTFKDTVKSFIINENNNLNPSDNKKPANRNISQTNNSSVPVCPTPCAPALLSAIRRCQGFRVRAA